MPLFVAERIRLTPSSWKVAVHAAARVLRGGGVAFLPAEGVYGLHARADLPAAMARLRALKPRSPWKGIIGLVAAPSGLEAWCDSSGPGVHELVEAHWPGALTLVLPASASVPKGLLAPDGSVALRCPGSEFLRAVVAAAGGLVASTSANAPGDPPAVSAGETIAEETDLIVDAGTLSGVPSTLVEIREGVVRVLRDGAVRIATGRS